MEQPSMIKLLDNGMKVKIKLNDEYRLFLQQALQTRMLLWDWPEYEAALALETIAALEKSPTRLRLSEFLFLFDQSTMTILDEQTQLLIRDQLQLNEFMKSRIPQSLTKLLEHE